MTQAALSGIKNKAIIVLGGNGFIGRHIVTQLREAIPTVMIGTRALNGLNPYQRQIRFHEMLEKKQWIEALAGIDMVVNAVGILRERKGESFAAVHHLAVSALVEACAELGIKLVHISAIGLHEGLKAPFSVSKKKGEQALLCSEADWHIVRASLVEGEGAYGASWFKKLAQWPIHFVPAKHALISPVHVNTLAEKVVDLLVNETKKVPLYHRIHELSNGEDYLLPEYLVRLNGGKKRFQVFIPDLMVRMVTRVCDRFNLTPLTYGHYELLKYDSCPTRS